MKKHTRIYMNHFNYGIDDFIGCEMCGAKAVDIHHIEPKGMGGSKTKDFIANLVALCRSCHTRCHSDKEFSSRTKEKHLLNLTIYENKLR